MTKAILITALILCGSVVSLAQENNTTPTSTSTDSVADLNVQVHQLEEFVVEGRSQLVGKEGIAFFPSKKEVKHAHDAFSLVQTMGIPFLKSDGYIITSFFTGTIDIFIDYLPASTADLASLQPKDVIKMEYLEYPSDPRFQGSHYVLNFIMRHVDDGGYVKTDIYQNLVHPFGNYSIYGKYERGPWSYDMSFTGMFSRKKTTDEIDTYYSGFATIDPLAENTVERRLLTRTKTDTYRINPRMRIKYTKKKTRISNTFDFSYTRYPKSTGATDLSFHPEIFSTDKSLSMLSFQMPAFSWLGSVYRVITPSLRLQTNANFNYSLNKTSTSYIYDEPQAADIDYIGRYATYEGGLNASLTYFLSDFDALTADVYGGWGKTDFSSEGSAIDEDYNQTNRNQLYSVTLGYTRSLYSGARISIEGRGSYRNYDFGGTRVIEWNPGADLNIYYPINNSNSLSANAQYLIIGSGPETKSDVLRRVNEIEWVVGNPDYKSGHKQHYSLSYTFTPTSVYSMAASASCNIENNLATEIWMPVEAYKIVRTWDYNGRHRQFYGGLALTLKLFNKSLHLSPEGAFNYHRFTNVQNQTYRRFNYSIRANYYLNDFSFGASFMSRQVTTGAGGQVQDIPLYYNFRVGYNHGSLSANITASQIFGPKRPTRHHINTSYYSTTVSTINEYTQSISLSVTYSFDFGKKKVNKWDTI